LDRTFRATLQQFDKMTSHQYFYSYIKSTAQRSPSNQRVKCFQLLKNHGHQLLKNYLHWGYFNRLHLWNILCFFSHDFFIFNIFFVIFVPTMRQSFFVRYVLCTSDNTNLSTKQRRGISFKPPASISLGKKAAASQCCLPHLDKIPACSSQAQKRRYKGHPM